MISNVLGLGLDIDFVEGNGLEDLSVNSLHQLDSSAEKSFEPKFALGFKDGEYIDFVAANYVECLRWIKSISIVRNNINYVQYLPFLEVIKQAL